MRVFIAIPIPQPCMEMLDRMQRRLKTSAADVRWTAIPSIHLTLKFLGENDPGIIPEIAGSLRLASESLQKIHIKLAGLGCFPSQKNPRIIWCGIRGDLVRLVGLQKTVEAVCMQSGFTPEDRPFQPHLTLGRVRGRRNLQRLEELLGTGPDLESSFIADRFNIYKSVLQPQGAVYTVLETIELKMQRTPSDYET